MRTDKDSREKLFSYENTKYESISALKETLNGIMNGKMKEVHLSANKNEISSY